PGSRSLLLYKRDCSCITYTLFLSFAVQTSLHLISLSISIFWKIELKSKKRSEMRVHLGFLSRKSSESPLSTRPLPEEAKKWSECFTTLMTSKYGSSLYRAFLLREYSNENLEFWLAVEYYRNTKPKKMAAKAQQIYKDFVAVQAPKEVNLDAETRLVTLNNIQSGNPDEHVFDRAQRRIQHMMERDSYLRFLQSGLFLELVHTENYPPC
ncbi:regulator of G-protein signaling 8-like, partial [Daphnia pulex]|uniref:regulator of G-protein signaling 8-like n=1 Tax=Daphnia pulex TaxID=6669 RepID=UPI001EDD6248